MKHSFGPLSCSTAALLLASLATYAPSQALVRDFNPTPTGGASSSNPGTFALLSPSAMLFVATTPIHGQELWRTDGTTLGTALVVDLIPGPNGSNIRDLTVLGNGRCVFLANVPGSGWEPWCTDGTVSGTFLLSDVRPGPDSSYSGALTRVGSQALFFANDGVHGIEPWITDGTVAGTRMLLDVVPGSNGMSNGAAEIAALGSGAGTTRAVFSAQIGGAWELWATDGTAAGSSSILQTGMTWSSGASQLTTFGNRVAFIGRTSTTQPECWITDGTASGTFSTLASTTGPLQVAGNRVYFPGWTLATDVELWATDGTVAGTGMVIDLNPGGYPNASEPGFVGELQGDLIFFGTDPAGRALFRTNGTAAGTARLSNAAQAGSLGSANWGVGSNGMLYYEVSGSAVPSGLYRTDGTAGGTSRLTAVDAGEIAAFGTGVLFAGDDGSLVGEELWRSDGTGAGTVLVGDLSQGTNTLSSYPTVLGTFGDRAIVSAETPTDGREVWLTDGTPAGTTLLFDIVPGSGSSQPVVAASDTQLLIFPAAWTGDGDPWFSDGSTSGTAQLDLTPPGSGFFGTNAAAFGDRFVFAGRMPSTGEEPWITDGTLAGTFPLGDVFPGVLGSSPRQWFRFGDRMLFRAYRPGPRSELWRTDGTVGGTNMLATLTDPSGLPLNSQMVEYGGYVWFGGWSSSQGVELWRTDGTPAGTALFFDAAPGAASSLPSGLTKIGNRLVMQVRINGATRLLTTDGTLAGTQLLNFTANQIAGPYPLDDTTAAFVVTPTFCCNTDELWRTDGTDAGTGAVRSIAFIAELSVRRVGNGRILFIANDGATGDELWTSDGTAAGTTRLTSLAPVQAALGNWVRAGEQIVFSGDDGTHGIELLAVPFAATGAWLFERYGSGCPGTGGLVPVIDRTGTATLGGAFGLTLDDALANSLALLALGQRRGASPLPGGCTLWLDGAFGLGVVGTDAQGNSLVPLPATAALLGARFDAQFLVVDPAGAAFGFLSSTGAAEFVFGP